MRQNESIAELVSHFKTLSDPAEAIEFERTHIWPLVKADFQAEVTEAYAVSFHTVGSSPQPVILAARALKAERIVLLHTAGTAQHCDFIEAEIERPPSVVERLEVDRSDPAPLYEGVSKLTRTLPQGAALAFEATSGTNKMVAAVALMLGALAKQGRKAHLYFMDYRGYDPELHRPIPGTEFLERFALPLG